jgi:dynein heavy chain
MGSEGDPRLAWLEDRLAAILGGAQAEPFRRILGTDAGRLVVEFLNAPEPRSVFFAAAAGASERAPELMVLDAPPPGGGAAGSGRFAYFVKCRLEPLTAANIDAVVAYGEAGGPPLAELQRLCGDVFLPLLSSREGRAATVPQEVLEDLHHLLANIEVAIGQSQGRTTLPLPNVDVTSVERVVKDKERVAVLEGAVVTWTRQVKAVLKADPEALLKAGEHPGPSAELEFWRGKANNLVAVQEQLATEKVRPAGEASGRGLRTALGRTRLFWAAGCTSGPRWAVVAAGMRRRPAVARGR